MRSDHHWRRIFVLLAAFGLSSALPAQIISAGGLGGNLLPKAAVKDDATARRAAMKEWYGDYTPEYRQFLMEAAQKERERWGQLIPGNNLFLPARAGGNHWANIGPTDATFQINGSTNLSVRDSGRVAALVIHPTDNNTIYNATSGGGVWKTTDGGSNWTPITEAIGSLSVGDLAMDPANPNTLYMGLGDSFDGTGVGMFKTIDGGANWTGPVFLGTSTAINAVSVSPTDPNVVLAGTNVGLFRSANANGGLGGGSFSPIALGSLVNPLCWSLVHAGGTNWVISVTTGTDATSGSWNGVKLFYSSDDGKTWSAPTGFAATGGRTTLASAPSNRAIVYAMVASDTDTTRKDLLQFYRSADAGHTWTSLGLTAVTPFVNANAESAVVRSLFNGQGWYDQMLLVDPLDSTTLWAGGALLLCKITGTTTVPVYTIMSNWLAQFALPYIHADFHAGAFAPDGTLYMGTDGGIFKRTNATTNTWTSSLNVGITSHLFYSVGSSPANTATVIGGLQDNGTRVRSGTTSTFNQLIGGDGFGSAVHQNNATRMLGSLYYADIRKSTNSGASFSAASGGIVESGDSVNAPFNTHIVLGNADSTGNTVFTHVNKKVYMSTVFAGSTGASWSALGTSGLPANLFIRNIGASRPSIDVVGIAANGGRVYTTTNGGGIWTQAAALPGAASYTSCISFGQQNSSWVYVASVAPVSTANHLWKSSNGGVAWTALDGSAATSNGFPFGVPVNSIVEDPGDDQTLYAGTHLGVYRSIDGGASWARFGAGLPLVNVTDFYISSTSSLMRVSTFGRGLWELDTSTVTATVTAPASDGLAFIHGSPITFTGSATDSGGGTLTYSWNFGDGSTGTGASTTHAYFNYEGVDVTYYATLTVTSTTGASASAVRSVVVHTAPPATAITLSYTPLSTSPITFTATASGSLNTPPSGYKYQWWRRLPGQTTWTMVQDFGSGTYVLTAPPGLNYGVGVDARTSAYPKAPDNWDVYTAVNFFNIVTGPIAPGGGSESTVAPAGSPTKGGSPQTFEQFLQLRRQSFEVPGVNQTEPKSQE